MLYLSFTVTVYIRMYVRTYRSSRLMKGYVQATTVHLTLLMLRTAAFLTRSLNRLWNLMQCTVAYVTTCSQHTTYTLLMRIV